MSQKAKIRSIKASGHLVGVHLPTNENGHAGRAVETILENMGYPINRGAGPDILDYDLEIKTRKESATSAQSITSMTPTDIVNTPYYDSPVYRKFRQQYRIKTNDNDVIISAKVYDFDQPQIQDLIEEAYEHARNIIKQDPTITYTPYSGHWGYFEKTKKDSESLDFRLTNDQMKKLEAMAESTFNKVFEYA